MIKRIIDQNGLFLRDDFAANDGEIALDVTPAQGFYHPKWDFELEQWIEGGVAPEPQPQDPTEADRLSAVESALASLMGV